MEQIPSYERSPYRTELEVEVLEVRQEGGRRCAVLDDTILFPEGGGQPSDHGWLNGVGIGDVRQQGGEILHYLEEGSVEVGAGDLRLDWERRFDHMQQHTAQHLLSALALARFDWKTRAFHLGEEICDIDLEVAKPGAGDIEDLEEAVAAQVAAARRIKTWRVSREEFSRLDVRSRGLPGDHTGDIRLVEIEGVDLNTCGGTHVGLTSEVGGVKIIRVESQRGGTRLFWVAGGRWRRRMARHEARNAQLRALLDTGDDELVEICRLKLNQLGQGKRQQRLLEERLVDAVCERLEGAPGRLMVSHLAGLEAALVRRVAEQITRSGGGRVVFLTADGGEGASFALAMQEGAGVDLQQTFLRICELLEGRGGGSGRIFQGRAGSLRRRAEAVAVLERVLVEPD